MGGFEAAIDGVHDVAGRAEGEDAIPLGNGSLTDESLRCCCGRDDCVFLKHNCAVLDNVEKDVHAAAKMGQVRSNRTARAARCCDSCFFLHALLHLCLCPLCALRRGDTGRLFRSLAPICPFPDPESKPPFARRLLVRLRQQVLLVDGG
jgi:hypothetical protein